MRRVLNLVTGPAAEPVTLDEAKAWLRIDGTDSDVQIAALITTAVQSTEQYLRRSLITQTWKLTLDLNKSSIDTLLGAGTYDLPITALYGGLPRVIELPKGPVQSITSVVTYDLDNTSSSFSSSNYSVDTAGERLVLTSGSIWPSNMRSKSACDITYVTGYGNGSTNVPAPIKTGILIQVAGLFEQRGMCDDPEGVFGKAQQVLSQYRILGSRG